jgi:hypothetical protein
MFFPVGRTQTVLLVGGLLLVTAASRRAHATSHTETVRQSPASYVVSIPKDATARNVSITIENTGSAAVVNPRLTLGGRLDWFDAESIVREALGEAKTDEEKVVALWEFARTQHQRMTPPGDPLVSDPVVMFNVYGYGNCGCISPALMVLAQVAGYQARVWELSGHTVCEVYFAGGWHMMDADTGRMFRDPSDKHILSVEEIQDRELWRVFKKDNRGYEEHGYDKSALSKHSMALTLRPGEKLVRTWKQSGKFYNYWARSQYKPNSAWWLPFSRYASGELVFRPQFTTEALGRDALAHEALVAKAQGAAGPALRVEPAAAGTDKTTHAGQVTYHVASPYVIVGAKLEANFFRARNSRGGEDWIAVDVRNAWTPERDDAKEGWVLVYGAAWTNDVGELPTAADFTDLFNTADRDKQGLYEYDIRFRFSASDPAQYPVGMSDLVLTTEIQAAPLSLPSLSPGDNSFRYRDETQGDRQVRITHDWEEAAAAR